MALAIGVVFFGPVAGEERKSDEDVVVTASRIDEPLDEVIWSTTVLDRKAIEARQPESLQDLLAGLAGVSVDNAGGLGKATSVFLRGGEGDHTLLLVNGLRVGSATVGTPPIELLPPEQIERIEIVRGPRSTLYGSDALGGVIQVFTRRAEEPGWSGRTAVTAGSHELVSGTADIAGRWGDNWLTVGASALETEGFNACLGAPFPPGGGCFTDEPDDDGFVSRSGSLTFGRQLSDRWSAELTALAVDAEAEFDGTFVNVTETTETIAAARLDGRLGEGWQVRLTAGRNRDDQSNLLAGSEESRFETTRDQAGVQLDGALFRGITIVSGIDLLRDRIGGSTAYDEDSRRTTGVFGELHGDAGRVSWVAGGRYEDNEQFGEHVTGNVGTGVRLTPAVRATLSWGTAFRAPTFNELYFPGFGVPTLEPEESRSLEAGLEGRHGAARWALNVYETEVDELISFDLATFLSANIANARIRGAELQGSWRSAKWSTLGQLTLLDAESRSDDFSRGNELPRRARESAMIEVRRAWPAVEAGVLARYTGARYNELANTTRLGGYMTVDLNAQYSFAPALAVQARVANLLDRNYTTAALYQQDGRHYSLTLRWQPASGTR